MKRPPLQDKPEPGASLSPARTTPGRGEPIPTLWTLSVQSVGSARGRRFIPSLSISSGSLSIDPVLLVDLPDGHVGAVGGRLEIGSGDGGWLETFERIGLAELSGQQQHGCHG